MTSPVFSSPASKPSWSCAAPQNTATIEWRICAANDCSVRTPECFFHERGRPDCGRGGLLDRDRLYFRFAQPELGQRLAPTTARVAGTLVVVGAARPSNHRCRPALAVFRSATL